MARWSRAARLVRLPPGSRVLDLGCAFGFGTRMLVGRYETYGHDLNHAYIGRARRSVRQATFTQGSADRVPYGDGFFDGILLLDVLEHVPEEAPVVKEITRLLRPGGRLILSVPNRGWLAPLDSLNVYQRVARGHFPPPTDDPSWQQSPVHRHYGEDDLARLLGPRFRILSSHYTGLGIAEPVNLVLLLLFRAVPGLRSLYNVLQYLYFGVYLLEDMIPTGPFGYHLMIEAERR
jgi:SAM-dependent methyltransferase